MQNDEWSSKNHYIDMFQFEWSINNDAGDGLIGYEQDHIWQTQVLMDILVNNTDFGNEWLFQIMYELSTTSFKLS